MLVGESGDGDVSDFCGCNGEMKWAGGSRLRTETGTKPEDETHPGERKRASTQDGQ